MRQEYRSTHARWQREVGIAIGPILFIIAILAILAAAIAAGSGSFTAPTATEFTADFGQRLPNKPLIAAPASGNARIIQRWSSRNIRA